ncbi:MAG: MBL fold metallo-hydrolase [archaeon GBS-70-058]|nr:MBL fold metallo-hydrolase [Candidatus Culexarchaeum nevadense]
MNYIKIVGGPLQTNTYLIYEGEIGIIVDPGAYFDRIDDAIKRIGVNRILYIIATHGHFDHIFYANKLSKNFNVPLMIHELDVNLTRRYSDLAESMYCEVFIPPENIKPISSECAIKLPWDVDMNIIHTPGHTMGSICIAIGNILLTGDTLFKNSIGRVDFDESSEDDMWKSLRKLIELDGDYIVLPGHGEITTMKRELKENPYLKGLWDL